MKLTKSELEQRLNMYEEKFGAIENYADNRTRVTNTQAITVSVMLFAESVRELTKKYSYIKNYESVIGSLDHITRKEFNETVSALKNFVSDFREVDEGGVIIDVDYKVKGGASK